MWSPHLNTQDTNLLKRACRNVSKPKPYLERRAPEPGIVRHSRACHLFRLSHHLVGRRSSYGLSLPRLGRRRLLSNRILPSLKQTCTSDKSSDAALLWPWLAC